MMLSHWRAIMGAMTATDITTVILEALDNFEVKLLRCRFAGHSVTAAADMFEMDARTVRRVEARAMARLRDLGIAGHVVAEFFT